jgi:hypothetical protein
MQKRRNIKTLASCRIYSEGAPHILVKITPRIYLTDIPYFLQDDEEGQKQLDIIETYCMLSGVPLLFLRRTIYCIYVLIDDDLSIRHRFRTYVAREKCQHMIIHGVDPEQALHVLQEIQRSGP